jgi:rhodanese-related sulfurtransferase
MNDITFDELKEAIDGGDTILIDALSAEDYAQGHLPGALSIPVGRANELAATLLPDRNAAIITYCGGAKCEASRKLADELRALGYTDVSEYTAGKEEWVGKGLPLEEGAPMPPQGRPDSAGTSVSQ